MGRRALLFKIRLKNRFWPPHRDLPSGINCKVRLCAAGKESCLLFHFIEQFYHFAQMKDEGIEVVLAKGGKMFAHMLARRAVKF